MGAGSGGHNAKPTAIKKLQGDAGHRLTKDMVEPQPEPGLPEMPKGMRSGARREFKHICPQLQLLGLLTVVDGKALMAYCDAYAEAEVARRDFIKRGAWLDTPVMVKGTDDEGMVPLYHEGQLLMVRKVNPSFTVYCAAIKIMKSFLTEFGLTPASRSRLKIEPPKKVDPMDEYLKAGSQQTATTKAAFDDLDEKDLKIV